MHNEARAMEDCLDEMALKIMMVEPGNLSVVGELLELAERLMAADVVAKAPQLAGMSKAFWRVLELIIMGEAADSGENYDRLAQCIVQMQEIARKKEEAGDQPLVLFCENMAVLGYRIEPRDLVAVDAGAVDAGAGEVTARRQSPAGEEKTAAAVIKATMPDFMQDRELISGFIAEASEHLDSIEVNILELEKNPNDREIINNIFRTFHTIKGVSGFLNLSTINELAHSTENLLDDVRNGKMEMKSEVIDVVLNVGDFMSSMIRNIKDVLERGPEQYLEFDIGNYVERILTIQRDAGANSLEEQEPKLEQEFPPDLSSELEFESDSESTSDFEFESEFESEEEEEEEEEEELEADLLATAIGETEKTSNLADILPAPSSMSNRANHAGQKGMAVRNRVVDAIKVDVEKLDGLINAVGELVIMQSLVRQNPLVAAIVDPKLTRDFSQLSRITTEVQRTAMSMRMVPIRQTFKKMIRLVRDLSRKSGKRVDLIMSGEETEIDRNMVDSIYDPLVHMIRNSVDHGVQPPAERVKLGKSPVGTLHLRAYQKGGNIVIEIEDDGQGLNAEKIRKKAIELGLLNADDKLSDHRINNFIFLPGFSTADKVTDVSGRGVGMDVVKKSVEKLRGTVEVQSQPSKGSLFLLRLPLTLAIIDGIIVRVGLERYVVPTISIQESLRPAAANYSTVHGKGENLLIRDKLIPIIRLYEKFGVVPTHTDPLQAIMVVVENEGRKRALMVDELLGKQEVVIKSLGVYLHDTRGVAGGTILGDGRVGLILDLAGIIGTAGNDTAHGTAAKGEAGPSAAEIS